MSRDKSPETVILVIDDDSEVLNALRLILESEQYSVMCASSTREAERVIAKRPPDLILSDLFMPDDDGLSFFERIRRETTLNDIPFVLLTGVNSEESKLQAQRSGCAEYLVKPIEPEILLAVIEGKLSLAKQRKQFSAQKMKGLHKKILHTLSHEFRTPLVSIQAGAEILLDRSPSDDDDETSKLILEAILTGGRRLQRLVEDFMLLQQLDLNQDFSPEVKPKSTVALSRLVEKTVEDFVSQRRLNKQQPVVNFSVVGDGALKEVSVTGEYLSDMLSRFLENAQKFGGFDTPIDVCVALGKPYAEVIIRDHGPGFLEESNAEQVFEPFMQIRRDEFEQQGCGVGLTIARFLAKLNGCQLYFTSPKEGQGTAVHIMVPTIELDEQTQSSVQA